MIANFSSLIEFIAAVYVTMCLNNDIFKRFWTPDHYSKIKAVIGSYNFQSSSNQFEKLLSDIRSLSKRIDSISRKKGAFMLGVCVLLLIFIGFEEENSQELYEPLVYGCLCSFIILGLQKIIFKKWKYVVFSMILLIVIYFISFSCLPCWYDNQFYRLVFDYLIDHKKILIIILVLFPILHQLTINWLYSSVYRGYLKDRIHDEYEKYDNSKKGIEQRRKDLIDKEYLQAWNDEYFNNGGLDWSLTIFNQVLNRRLIQAVTPSVYILCWSLLKHWCTYKIPAMLKKKNKKIDSSNSGVEIPAEYIHPQYSQVLDFTVEYNNFLRWRTTCGEPYPSLKLFCDQNNIKYKDMVAWVKVNKPSRKL